MEEPPLAKVRSNQGHLYANYCLQFMENFLFGIFSRRVNAGK